MTTTKCVCVWYDDEGTPDDPRWVVCVEEIDLATNETSITNTIQVMPAGATESEAIEAGKRHAVKRDLPLYRFQSSSDGYGLGNRHVLVEAR